MPSLPSIKASNATLSTKSPDLALTAVFVGATSGIGIATLKAFAKHIPQPTAIIVGRSRARFESHLKDLQKINPAGKYEFIEHEVELVRDIDTTCSLISDVLSSTGEGKANKKIDLLYVSQGYISFSGRQPNADGLDASISLRYYGRVRFTRNLLPFLGRRARVISILAGTQEGKIFEEDLDLERNYSIPNSMGHFASMMSLSFDSLAAQSQSEVKERIFVHAFPGLVSTGLLGKSATGLLGVLFRWVVEPVMGLLVASRPEDVGERMLFYGTAEEFGEEVGKEKCVAVDDKSEVKEIDVLKGYRERGFAEKVTEWEGRVFERATAEG